MKKKNIKNETKIRYKTTITTNGMLPDVKITWVAVEERLPEVEYDFETMLETQALLSKYI